MFLDPTAIMQALAPGVALTSAIFYYGNLQSRMIFTVETIRRLNAEARELQGQAPTACEDRIRSIRWQVNFLKQRFVSIHRAILIVYTAFISFIVTIVSLFARGVFQLDLLVGVAILSFSAGFFCMGLATVVSSREIRLSRKTIFEDIDSSHQWASPISPERPRMASMLLSERL